MCWAAQSGLTGVSVAPEACIGVLSPFSGLRLPKPCQSPGGQPCPEPFPSWWAPQPQAFAPSCPNVQVSPGEGRMDRTTLATLEPGPAASEWNQTQSLPSIAPGPGERQSLCNEAGPAVNKL